MSKKCTPLWPEAHFEVKSVKNWWLQSTSGSWDVENAHGVVARSTFRSQFAPLLDVQMSFCVAGARDSAPGQKWGKTSAFCSMSKMAAVGHSKRICENAFFRGRRSTRDMCIRAVRRSRCRFLARGCGSSGLRIILRDRCSISYDLASIFRGRSSTLDTWTGKAVSSALNFPLLKKV